MALVKMVKGGTYSHPVFGAGVIVSKGDVIEVADSDLDTILAEGYLDALNNDHRYFELHDGPAPVAQVAAEQEEGEAEGEEENSAESQAEEQGEEQGEEEEESEEEESEEEQGEEESEKTDDASAAAAQAAAPRRSRSKAK